MLRWSFLDNLYPKNDLLKIKFYQYDTTCEMCQVACQEVPLFFPVLPISGCDTCWSDIDTQSNNKEINTKCNDCRPVFPFWKKVPEKFPGRPEYSALDILRVTKSQMDCLAIGLATC